MPISKSVGASGANGRADTSHVQVALCIWRNEDKLTPIKIDGIVGPETIGAIRDYQQRNGLITDGRVDPDGPTIVSIETDLIATIEGQLGRAVQEILQPAVHGLGPNILPNRMRADVMLAYAQAIRMAGDTQDGSATGPLIQLAGFRRPGIVFAAAPAVPLIIAVDVVEVMLMALLITVAVLILILMLPTLGRAAEDLIEKIRILMAELLDGIKAAIEGVEDLVRRNTRAGMRCSAELIAFRALSAQLILELTAPRSSNPIEQQQRINRISNLFQKWKAALEAVLACLVANGAV